MIEDMYNQPRTAKPVHSGGTKLSQGSKFNVLTHEGKEIQIPAANYIKEMAKELTRLTEDLRILTNQNRSLLNELKNATRRLTVIEGKLGK